MFELRAASIKCFFGIHSFSYWRDIGKENPISESGFGILFYSDKRCYCEFCGKEKKMDNINLGNLPELLPRKHST
ncbi:MAG: hypothetical protein OEM38_09270 [Gammaproteobacteria bacterium]|nr:hypothetical protein [Gammaproteobacteria bacterium]